MKTSVVLTTIFNPSKAVCKMIEKCQQYKWDLIIVGDRKTPHLKWKNLKGCRYIEPGRTSFRSEQLPLDSYERKNIGYLQAYKDGADFIISTDDDNIPLDNWKDLITTFENKEKTYSPTICNWEGPLANYLTYFTNTTKIIWPRGLPPDKASIPLTTNIAINDKIGFVAGLWNGAPDFDAVGHILYSDKDWHFLPDRTLYKPYDTFCPYNTQNTALARNIIPYQFLPPRTERANDIWTSYISQKIMYHLKIGGMFISPTVFQKRNPHNLLEDVRKEEQLITKTRTLFDIMDVVEYKDPISYLLSIYQTGTRCGLFHPDTMKHLENWLLDLGV